MPYPNCGCLGVFKVGEHFRDGECTLSFPRKKGAPWGHQNEQFRTATTRQSLRMNMMNHYTWYRVSQMCWDVISHSYRVFSMFDLGKNLSNSSVIYMFIQLFCFLRCEWFFRRRGKPTNGSNLCNHSSPQLSTTSQNYGSLVLHCVMLAIVGHCWPLLATD